MNLQTRTLDSAVVLQLDGRFDAHAAPLVREWFDKNVAPQLQLVISLAGVNFVDSTGMAALLHVMKRARQAGGEVYLCALQQPVRIIFELTSLDRAFSIFGSEHEVISSLRQETYARG